VFAVRARWRYLPGARKRNEALVARNGAGGSKSRVVPVREVLFEHPRSRRGRSVSRGTASRQGATRLRAAPSYRFLKRSPADCSGSK